jgi:hypothetical protein
MPALLGRRSRLLKPQRLVLPILHLPFGLGNIVVTLHLETPTVHSGLITIQDKTFSNV